MPMATLDLTLGSPTRRLPSHCQHSLWSALRFISSAATIDAELSAAAGGPQYS